MAVPISTRDLLIRVLGEHALGRPYPHDCSAECVADDLLASVVVDAAALADDEALVGHVSAHLFQPRFDDDRDRRAVTTDTRDALQALAATLTERSGNA